MRIASAEALARLLAQRLSETGPPGRAVTVAQLIERVLPYPVVRERLGLAGKAEYDLALLGLLSDRVLLQLDPALHEAARKELEQPEPGLRSIEKLSECLLRLRDPDGVPEGPREAGPVDAPDAIRVDDGEPAPDSPGPADAPGGEHAPVGEDGPVGEHAPVGEYAPAREDASEPRDTPLAAPDAPSPMPAVPPADPSPPFPLVRAPVCWNCAVQLPTREGVRFCPHCGVDQHAQRCTSCGDRLEPGWSYCPRCGRALAPP